MPAVRDAAKPLASIVATGERANKSLKISCNGRHGFPTNNNQNHSKSTDFQLLELYKTEYE